MTALLKAFTESLKAIEQIPYVTGKIPLNESNSTLFFRSGQDAKCVNFMSPTEEQLQDLAASCQPATFGVAQKDVLDESYRKAGKMDVGKFALPLIPQDLGALEVVRTLLHGKGSEKSVRFELYKLNVYGPGAFFKAHVDTPRSDKMFGSLVLVLPTQHEGGALVFRHREKEWTFDSAKAVSTADGSAPHAAFAVFWSDVEHEVLPVTSGYRVTITYNLYSDDVDRPDLTITNPVVDGLREVANKLLALLKDKTFLPNGGLIGFGLDHTYPFNRNKTKLSEIEKNLKGRDALLYKACKLVLKLDVSLRAYYTEDGQSCLFTDFPDLSEQVEDNLIEYLIQEAGGKGVRSVGPEGSFEDDDEDDDEDGDEDDRMLPIVWVKPLGDSNRFSDQYIHYGNEASLSCTYGNICMIIKV